MIKVFGNRWLKHEKGIYLRTLLRRKRRRETDINQPKSLLCLQLSAIGDVIMTQPAWAALKDSFSDATIDLVCRPHIAPLFTNDEAINSIFPFESRKYRSWLLRDIRRLERIWFEQHYDLIIDFSATPLSAAVCARRAAPPSLGFQRLVNAPLHSLDLGLAYDHVLPYSETEPLRNLMVRLTGFLINANDNQRVPILYLSESSRKRAGKLLDEKGLVKKEFILLHPGAKWPPKRWPNSHWRQLIEKLSNGLNLPILVLGGKDDEHLVYDVVKGFSRKYARHLISDAIDTSAAIIQSAGLCASNDSAPMHIAAAVGTRSVAIFGPVSPNRSGPSATEKCKILYDKMFCSPCRLYYSRQKCRRGMNFCMYAVRPETVYREIKESLKQEN